MCFRFHVRGFHSLWRDFPDPSTIFHTAISQSIPRRARTTVWALPRSLAATYGIDVSFSSSAYLDVSVQRVPSVYLWIQYTVTEVCSAGFPHSDICGSSDICSLPQLFAAYHVFLRLSVPRHPPCALFSLTLCFESFGSRLIAYANCSLTLSRHPSLASQLFVFIVQFSMCKVVG